MLCVGASHAFGGLDGTLRAVRERLGALVRWALQQPPGSDDGAAALLAAREHRQACLHGYRRHLGFAVLVLTDLPDAPGS